MAGEIAKEPEFKNKVATPIIAEVGVSASPKYAVVMRRAKTKQAKISCIVRARCRWPQSN